MPFCYQGREHLFYILKNVGGMFIALYTNSSAPTLATVWADLTEATFPGYSQQSPSLTDPALNGDDDAEMNFSAPVVFTQSSNDTPQLVYGAVLIHTYGGGNKLWDWLHFPAPISMSLAGQTITIDNWRIREGALAV